MLVKEIVRRDLSPRCLFDAPHVLDPRKLAAEAVFLNEGALTNPGHTGKFRVAHLVRGQPILEGHAPTVSSSDTVCQLLGVSAMYPHRIQSPA
jgi:hypothetical protein